MFAFPTTVFRFTFPLMLFACCDGKPATGRPSHREAALVEGNSEQAKPEQAKPEQAKPEQAKPEQVKPEQVEPEQAKPGQVEQEAAEPVQPQPGTGAFVAYREQLSEEQVGGSGIAFDMVPIGGGSFVMGSRAGEMSRRDDEGPRVEVRVDSFWMGKFEVTWAEYDAWIADDSRPQSKKPDGMARPTPAYMDMTFNMGRDGYPAICMSHVAARQYCKWLSEKSGHFYRLPTEAEWEYACRAGTSTAWSCGDDSAALGEIAWFADNSARVLEPGAPPEPAYHPVGGKAANAWGLFDMHGNVAEWVADFYIADAYDAAHGASPRDNPYFVPPQDKRGRPVRFSHVVRGGSWRHPAADLRSAARLASEPDWNERDPQVPESWWYLTDGQHVGFRIVRPHSAPSADERARFEAL